MKSFNDNALDEKREAVTIGYDVTAYNFRDYGGHVTLCISTYVNDKHNLLRNYLVVINIYQLTHLNVFF